MVMSKRVAMMVLGHGRNWWVKINVISPRVITLPQDGRNVNYSVALLSWEAFVRLLHR
jgi:hypothetical protein